MKMKSGTMKRIVALVFAVVLAAGTVGSAQVTTSAAELTFDEEADRDEIMDVITEDVLSDDPAPDEELSVPESGIEEEEIPEIGEDPTGDPAEEVMAEEIMIEETDDNEEPLGATNYDLWVGSTRVTSTNKDNIFGIVGDEGAKASYDPDTKTLTFSGGVTGVTGYHTDSGISAMIVSEDDLTIAGTARLEDEGATGFSAVFGKKSLTVSADLNIKLTQGCGMFSSQDMTISGTVTVNTGSGDMQAIQCQGEMTICGNVTANRPVAGNKGVDIQSGTVDITVASGKALHTSSGGEFESRSEITIASGLDIVEPADGKISDDKTFISASDGTTPASHVMIRKGSPYGLYIGNTAVTDENRSNISGVTGNGAKASYDPKKKILTFTNVTGIEGTYNKSGSSYKIYSNDDLTIKGTAVIDKACTYGVMGCKKLNIEGDLTIRNAETGVQSEDDLTITGNLTIEVAKTGVNARTGLHQKGNLTIETSASYSSGTGIRVNDIDKGIVIEGGKTVITCAGLNQNGISVSNGNLTISSGSLEVEIKSRGSALSITRGIVMTGGTLEAHQKYVDYHSVLCAGSATLTNMLIAEPEYGKILPKSGTYDVYLSDGTTLSKDVKIVPDDPDQYVKVAFLSRGEEISKKIVEKGTALSSFPVLPDDSSGYFIGWYYDQNFLDRADPKDVFMKDKTLYAKWSPASAGSPHTVRFYSTLEGFNIPAQKVEDGGCAVEPSRLYKISGRTYRVVNWYVRETGEIYDFTAPVTADLNIQVTLDEVPNDASFKMEFLDTAMFNEDSGHWEVTYSGKKQTFIPGEKIELYDALGYALESGTDYTLSYKNNLNVDKKKKPAYVTAKGKGKYKKTKKLPFYIVPRSIVNDALELDTANGFRMEPIVVEKGKKISPVIYYNGVKLTSKDYTLSNKGKINADTTVDITGKGNFKGTLSNVPVHVLTKSDLKKQSVKVTLKAGKHTYTPGYDDGGRPVGLPQTLTVSKEEGGVVTKGELTVKDAQGNCLKQKIGAGEGDFTVSYVNNINAGTATVIVSGVAPYTGSVKKTFKIDPNTDVTITEINSIGFYAPSGVEFVTGGVKPDEWGWLEAEITDSSEPYYSEFAADSAIRNLEKGRDYKISYTDNKAISGAKKAKYRISFLGNYKGHKELTGEFTIIPGKFKPQIGFLARDGALEVTAADMVYSGKKKYESVPYVSMGGKPLDSKNYSVKYFYRDGEGEHEITGQKIEFADGETSRRIRVDVTGKGNYKAETVSRYYYVRKAGADQIDLSKAKIAAKGNKKKKAVGNQTYCAGEICPEVDVYVKVKKKWVLVDPASYSVSYVNNINKGTAVILVTGKGGAAVGSKTAKFKILPKNLGGFLAKLRIGA
ncbi:MAG: carbohydrate-binding domain-containing protein [Lachnospiraceae bacterium]|nr:carbohydrate-binding domain-containing protein [Lachnospiraceae bacterium]